MDDEREGRDRDTKKRTITIIIKVIMKNNKLNSNTNKASLMTKVVKKRVWRKKDSNSMGLRLMRVRGGASASYLDAINQNKSTTADWSLVSICGHNFNGSLEQKWTSWFV